jgi:hypothetical protein
MPHELVEKTDAKTNDVSRPKHRKTASSEGQSAAEEMRDVPSQLPRNDLGNRVFYDLLQLYTSVKPVQIQRTQPNNQNQQQTRSKRSANLRVPERTRNGYESELGGVAPETETRRRAHQRNAKSLGSGSPSGEVNFSALSRASSIQSERYQHTTLTLGPYCNYTRIIQSPHYHHTSFLLSPSPAASASSMRCVHICCVCRSVCVCLCLCILFVFVCVLLCECVCVRVCMFALNGVCTILQAPL